MEKPITQGFMVLCIEYYVNYNNSNMELQYFIIECKEAMTRDEILRKY